MYENATRKEQNTMDGFMSAKMLLCRNCRAELGIVMSTNRIRIGGNGPGAIDAALPVDAKCACGQEHRLDSYDDCIGPLCEYPTPLANQ